MLGLITAGGLVGKAAWNYAKHCYYGETPSTSDTHEQSDTSTKTPSDTSVTDSQTSKLLRNESLDFSKLEKVVVLDDDVLSEAKEAPHGESRESSGSENSTLLRGNPATSEGDSIDSSEKDRELSSPESSETASDLASMPGTPPDDHSPTRSRERSFEQVDLPENTQYFDVDFDDEGTAAEVINPSSNSVETTEEIEELFTPGARALDDKQKYWMQFATKDVQDLYGFNSEEALDLEPGAKALDELGERQADDQKLRATTLTQAELDKMKGPEQRSKWARRGEIAWAINLAWISAIMQAMALTVFTSVLFEERDQNQNKLYHDLSISRLSIIGLAVAEGMISSLFILLNPEKYIEVFGHYTNWMKEIYEELALLLATGVYLGGFSLPAGLVASFVPVAMSNFHIDIGFASRFTGKGRVPTAMLTERDPNADLQPNSHSFLRVMGRLTHHLSHYGVNFIVATGAVYGLTSNTISNVAGVPANNIWIFLAPGYAVAALSTLFRLLSIVNSSLRSAGSSGDETMFKIAREESALYGGVLAANWMSIFTSIVVAIENANSSGLIVVDTALLFKEY
ncbi:hypothetical protein HOK22_01115, partial [Candidatus Peregrinibacteria bacterium]|nr:hypothetical protein [Candidatus Peregrinibacteria bacterium]